MAGTWLATLDPIADERAVDRRRNAVYVQDSLRDVMRQVRTVAPNARRYVTTYPNPLSAASCDAIGMDESESRFLSEIFLPRLNDEIKLAASLEGFRVVDLFDVFRGAGLCARGPDRHGPAVNAWRFQDIDALTLNPNDLLRGSMHPTGAGHARIARRVEAAVRAGLTNGAQGLAAGPPPARARPGRRRSASRCQRGRGSFRRTRARGLPAATRMCSAQKGRCA